MNNESPHNNYRLSIRFTPGGFSLSVYDKVINSLISTKKQSLDLLNLNENQLLDALESQSEFKQTFSDLRLIIESECYSTIPEAFYTNENAENILKFQYPELSTSQSILKNDLIAWNATIVFAVHKPLESVLKSMFPEIPIEHHLFALINDEIPLSGKSAIYVFLRTEKLDLILLEEGQLSLVNSFRFDTNEDVLYHIMNVYENKMLSKETCELTIFNPNKELEHLLLTYIHNIKFRN
ncbi:MAG: DUF3822 family protein [Paludibacter sp.]|nr:DUF3822 family protein [Paludibacter sp.]